MMMLETGTVLNNIYRVIKLLGKGGMGNVYLVERIKDDKKFVVKELVFAQEANIDGATAKEIFFREAEFMAKFSHPGLPNMYGVFSHDGREYLTMDYIEGKTLEEIINSSKEPVEVQQAITWTIKIAEILDYLHNAFHAPVVYRDLKPSNIIITPGGWPKLVDFGIARYYNPDKDTDTFKYGSPGYAAPEQYKGRGQSTPLSDIYGLGVILHQMLTKHDPTLKLFNFPPVTDLNFSVSKELEAIVKRAMELDPLKRYISMNEFKEQLERYTGIYKKDGTEEDIKKPNNFARAGILMAILTIFSPYVVAIILNIAENISRNFSGPLQIFMRKCLNTGPVIIILLPVTGLIFSIIGSRKAKYDRSISQEPALTAIVFNLLAIMVVCLLGAVFVPGFFAARAQGQLASCESNIKNLAAALEMYATDNRGYYPPALSYLTYDKNGGPYIKHIYTCPVYLTGYKYVYATSPDNFTICCEYNNAHRNALREDGSWPQYTPGRGLIVPQR
ncbi:MAG: serine/threonine-protein kinase [Candidatus Eremiobacterota bacterium]